MKKISQLLIGSNNKGKLKEIKALLPKRIKIYSTSDFNIKSPVENGKTFEDNSIIKSKYFSKKTNLPCLADDSGLEIDILNKAPGIYSARWGGKNSDFNKAIKRVYKELDKKDKNWKKKKIKARFVCSLSISYLEKLIACVRGKVEGTISTEPKGNNGFGYDPIFIPKDKRLTFGEMSSKAKYKMDHRFNAFKKIKKFLLSVPSSTSIKI
jgi:XTP/dITP diphosphohydrolase